jgi:hypothetical protein
LRGTCSTASLDVEVDEVADVERIELILDKVWIEGKDGDLDSGVEVMIVWVLVGIILQSTLDIRGGCFDGEIFLVRSRGANVGSIASILGHSLVTIIGISIDFGFSSHLQTISKKWFYLSWNAYPTEETMLISEGASGLGLKHDNWNLWMTRMSGKSHGNSGSSSVDAGLGRTIDKTDVIAVSDNVSSGQVGAKRSVLHPSDWINLDQAVLGWFLDDKFPTHDRKILISWNDAQQADSLGEELVKANLLDVCITDIRIRFGLDGPKVLPVVILP